MIDFLKMSDNSPLSFIKFVQNLKRGYSFIDSNGTVRKVSCVVKFKCETEKVYEINEAFFVKKHPVKINGVWTQVQNIAIERKRSTLAKIYGNDAFGENNFYRVDLLMEDLQPIDIGEIPGQFQVATLGFNSDESDVFHPYFSSNRVVEDIKNHPDFSSGLIIFDRSNLVKDDNGNTVGLQY